MLTVEEITQKLKPVFEANGVTKAILFGSYAKGCATEDSDLDIVVDTEPHVRGIDFFGIIEDIRQKLDDIEVDLIPQRSIIPDGRSDLEIKETGLVIYEK
ncbi:MAG: nucleotidyltransferase domain-containing protein [Defluviitaleaceae bacterium]|nr:nucleotidyltransferase domain-containing protein [Defluviitaleaceae bacterium]